MEESEGRRRKRDAGKVRQIGREEEHLSGTKGYRSRKQIKEMQKRSGLKEIQWGRKKEGDGLGRNEDFRSGPG